MRDTRAYANEKTPGLAPAFVRRRPLSSAPTPEQHPSKMHRLAGRRLSVNAFPKRPGANFIPLTPLAFIDRARHVSRVLHVFGLALCRRSWPPADGAKLSPRRWRGGAPETNGVDVAVML